MFFYCIFIFNHSNRKSYKIKILQCKKGEDNGLIIYNYAHVFFCLFVFEEREEKLTPVWKS